MRDLLRLCMCQLTGKIDWDRPDPDITSKVIKACRGADFPTIERKLLKVATAQTKPDVEGWGYWLGVANNQFGDGE